MIHLMYKQYSVANDIISHSCVVYLDWTQMIRDNAFISENLLAIWPKRIFSIPRMIQ